MFLKGLHGEVTDKWNKKASILDPLEDPLTYLTKLAETINYNIINYEDQPENLDYLIGKKVPGDQLTYKNNYFSQVQMMLCGVNRGCTDLKCTPTFCTTCLLLPG